ncbi:MAG: hemerythrin domain-containing protein [Halobacteriota archaeon]
MEIGEAITVDHREFKRIIEKMEKTTENDVELRKQLLPHFMVILNAHHVAEEEVLFPEMYKKGMMENLARDLTEEHRAMMILLHDLRVSGWDFKFWNHRLRPIREIIVPHWGKEEELLIPHMSNYFSQAEIDELSTEFDAVRTRERKAK